MAGLVTVKSIVEQFMEAFTKGELDSCRDCFSEEVRINYSTVGVHTGITAIIKALEVGRDFDIHYTTIANVMEYENGETAVVMAKGHHLLAYREDSFLYPLLFGGKYEFSFNKNTKKITEIKFYLEYEFGNTYVMKNRWGWNMYEETKDLKTSINGGYQQYTPVSLENEEAVIQNTLYQLMWDFDNEEYDHCLKRVTDDIYVRVKVFEEVGPSKEYYQKEEFVKLMKDYFAYEDQPQISLYFENIAITDDTAIVHIKRYNPGKVVNKHVDVSTIHKLFFNMRFVLRMVKRGGAWLVSETDITPINDVDALGFDYIEVKANELNSIQAAFYR